MPAIKFVCDYTVLHIYKYLLVNLPDDEDRRISTNNVMRAGTVRVMLLLLPHGQNLGLL
jgi:hypothetical protein